MKRILIMLWILILTTFSSTDEFEMACGGKLIGPDRNISQGLGESLLTRVSAGNHDNLIPEKIETEINMNELNTKMEDKIEVKGDVTRSSTGTGAVDNFTAEVDKETILKRIEVNNKEIEKLCVVCMDVPVFKETKEVFHVKPYTYRPEDAKDHLKHAWEICEKCMQKWQNPENSEEVRNVPCPICRLILNTETGFVQAWTCASKYGKLLLHILSIPNILFPWFLSIRHGVLCVLIKQVFEDFQYMDDSLESFLINVLSSNVPALITTLAHVNEDVFNYGEDNFISEDIISPVMKAVYFIGVPLSASMLKSFLPMPRRMLLVSRCMEIANYFLPLIVQDDFYAMLYWIGLFSTMFRKQETHWLLFLVNIFIISYFGFYYPSIPKFLSYNLPLWAILIRFRVCNTPFY